MPVATSALYGTDSPITHVAFEHPFQPRLNSLEPINASAGFVNANSTYSFLDSLSPFTYSAQAMDTYSNPFPTPPTIRIDPRHTPLEEIPTRQAQFPPIPSDLQAHFAKLPRPPLVSHTIIDYESQDGLLPTPAHKLDLTAPLRLLSSNSIDRGPIPPPAMSPHPFLPPQPKSFVRPLPKPRTPPHRSKANKKCSHQPSKLLEVILERPNLPSPSLPNPKAVVPPKQKIHTFRTFIPQSQRQNGSEQATVIPEHPNSHFPSPPKAKAKGPPMPTIRSFRTFVPQSQRQNGSEQATVIPEHPNSHFPSPPKAKAKGPPMPTIRSFRTFVPQSQRQNGSEEVFTIVQSDPVKPHPVGKAKSLPHQPPRPKAKRRHQPPKAASVPPNQDAGRREIHFEASSFHPFQRCYSYEEQSLADGLQCLFGGPYYLNNIFFYEPVRYLKKRVRLFHLWKNMNLFEYYVPYFRPEARQRWYIGTVGDVIDRRLRIAWIKHEQFPDNVFLDMSILTPIEERNIRPKALVVFLIRVNKYPSSYFEAREAFLWPGKVQDISIRLI
ncbi:hypothetical protein BLNAU_23900 [Blattamonas nauphoetae]|uniref:Uncharacterized protein n=1 Tax=Blattamonas nauphoetae TaxID=2049346 RepID=A0ABQ9WRU4_9EUKA|nr:hypothetical protein BLNAU_23900 [Blattamonas nauphoetae]